MAPIRRSRRITGQPPLTPPMAFPNTLKPPRSPLDGVIIPPKILPRGHLAKLLDVSMDIVVEVYLYLDPVELIYISRASKRLRRFLMLRSSRFIWRQSLLREGLSQTFPFGMIEPYYASIALHPECTFCKSHFSNVYWELRARYCYACFHSLAVSAPFFNRLLQQTNLTNFMELPKDVLPSYTKRAGDSILYTMYATSDWDNLQHKLRAARRADPKGSVDRVYAVFRSRTAKYMKNAEILRTIWTSGRLHYAAQRIWADDAKDRYVYLDKYR
ncbi:hypothetical protein HGRIS_012244 [Hohenbuehelia grisea]|uniref:F-box domain-containing protein n=1 Tax=Hohenbuehelia grisea TaxID=104357 RepID=A0ABR3IRP2_9AGAR